MQDIFIDAITTVKKLFTTRHIDHGGHASQAVWCDYRLHARADDRSAIATWGCKESAISLPALRREEVHAPR